MRAIITINFHIAVLSAIIFSIILIYTISQPFRTGFIHLEVYTMAVHIILPFVLLYLWQTEFKHHNGNLPAFVIGVVIFLFPALSAFIAELNFGSFYSDFQEYFNWYIATSFILYGLLDYKEIVRYLSAQVDP